MPRKTITIHITDAPDGSIAVLTTAAQPIPGARLTPAEALATDVLATCIHRARSVSYWQGKDHALALVRELLDPDGFGYSVTPEVRNRARDVLGHSCTTREVSA